MDKSINWVERSRKYQSRTDCAVKLLQCSSNPTDRCLDCDDGFLCMTIRNVINGDDSAFADWCRLVE